MVMIEQISIDVFVFLITSGIAGVAGFCAVVYRCTHKQSKRGYRQSQAILLLTKTIEEQTKQTHPEYQGGLYAQAEIILKDEKGEF